MSAEKIQIEIDDESASINGDPRRAYAIKEESRVTDGTDTAGLVTAGHDIYGAIFSSVDRRQLLASGASLDISIVSASARVLDIPFELINTDGTDEGFIMRRGNVSIRRAFRAISDETVPSPRVRVLPDDEAHVIHRTGLAGRALSMMGDGKYLVLHGLSGMGKTTLACYIARLHDARFRHLLCMDLGSENYKTPSALVDAIIEHFVAAGVCARPEQSAIESASRATQMWQWLGDRLGGRMLLVLDNLDAVMDRDGMLEDEWRAFMQGVLADERVFTILTTRLLPALWPDNEVENVIEVGEFEEVELGILLQTVDMERAGRFLETVEQFINRFGYHPLAITIALGDGFGRMDTLGDIREFQEGMDFYRDFLMRHHEDVCMLMSLRYPFTEQFIGRVSSPGFFSLVRNSLSLLRDLGGFYFPYNIVTMYFHADFVPSASMLGAFKDKAYEAFRAGGLGKMDLPNVFNALMDYHELTRDRDVLGAVNEVFCAISMEANPAFFAPVIARFVSVLDEVDPEDAYSTGTHMKLARVYGIKAEYGQAIEYLETVAGFREQRLGPDHPDTAKTYDNIASLYQRKGEIERAIEYQLKVLDIVTRALGADHPHTASTHFTLARLYQDVGNHDRAAEHFRQSLAGSIKAGDYEKMIIAFTALMHSHIKSSGYNRKDLVEYLCKYLDLFVAFTQKVQDSFGFKSKAAQDSVEYFIINGTFNSIDLKGLAGDIQSERCRENLRLFVDVMNMFKLHMGRAGKPSK